VFVACSGRFVAVDVYERIGFAAQTAIIAAALVALSLVLWLAMRRFHALFATSCLLLLTHPFFWDNGMSGDCGRLLYGSSIFWTVSLVGVVSLQATFWLFTPRTPARPGFPIQPVRP
jgi:hypothetical protein